MTDLQRLITDSTTSEIAYLRGELENVRRANAELRVENAGLRAALKHAQPAI